MIQDRENFQQSLKMQKLNAETALGHVARELLILQNLKRTIQEGKYVKLLMVDGKLLIEEPDHTIPLLDPVPSRPGGKS